jgi:hypothetical protein
LGGNEIQKKRDSETYFSHYITPLNQTLLILWETDNPTLTSLGADDIRYFKISKYYADFIIPYKQLVNGIFRKQCKNIRQYFKGIGRISALFTKVLQL